MYHDKQTLQIKVTLMYTNPVIWRRILVPRKYSFWDLHVAIQDAMGWLDRHLHQFILRKIYGRKNIIIGIHDDEFGEEKIEPGWERFLSDYLIEPGQIFNYEYDFGDSWLHEIVFEGILIKEKGQKYPKCIAGERACPPEDCGGITGFEELLEIIEDPKRENYTETMEWLGGFYIPQEFIPQKVKFDNPKKRFKEVSSD